MNIFDDIENARNAIKHGTIGDDAAGFLADMRQLLGRAQWALNTLAPFTRPTHMVVEAVGLDDRKVSLTATLANSEIADLFTLLGGDQ